MLSRQEYVRSQQVPANWSKESIDFTNRLILRKPQNRLGKDGIAEIKNHEWFLNFDWESLNTFKMKSPMKPIPLEQID